MTHHAKQRRKEKAKRIDIIVMGKKDVLEAKVTDQETQEWPMEFGKMGKKEKGEVEQCTKRSFQCN